MPDLPRCSLLIVDDHAPVRQMLTLFFTGEGYDVRTADDGAAALRSVQADRPDLVLLDLMMPVMTGREVLRVWKREGALPDLPVVAMTAAHGLAAISEEMQELGVRASVSKPFNLERLLALMEDLRTSR